jgi:predicted naringenin-chalcone synthase
MENETFLHSFHSVLPLYHLPQKKIVEWTLESHARSAGDTTEKFKDRLRHFTLNESQIRERYFDCPEVDDEWEQHRIYKVNAENPNGAGMDERNIFFKEKVSRVFGELYPKKIPAHLIHVTCTGYVSPSPAQIYFSKKETNPEITHAYHMGCYASLPSVRLGKAIAESERIAVDIVHTEMCSLHLNAALHTPEQMVVQTLFADGHIKYTISKESTGNGLLIKAIHEKILPDSEDDMTWIPGTHGMMMTLSREVPVKIRDSIPAFIVELCEKANISLSDIFKHGVFAIHPGGPRIIEAVQNRLELRDDQVEMSKKVLYERGNMSSATLPHVWKELMDQRLPQGTNILSLAFGPGLTIFGSIFEVRR